MLVARADLFLKFFGHLVHGKGRREEWVVECGSKWSFLINDFPQVRYSQWYGLIFQFGLFTTKYALEEEISVPPVS